MYWRQLIAAMVGTIALILGIASLMKAPKPDLAITIVGIPFGWAHAGLALWPIGKTIVQA